MEESSSENLSPEEVRQRRLAYFQSLTNKDKPPPSKDESKPPEKSVKLNNRNAGNNPSIPVKEQITGNIHNKTVERKPQPQLVIKQVPNVQTSQTHAPNLKLQATQEQIPNLGLQTNHEQGEEAHDMNEDGYNEAVERLIQLTKQEMAEKFGRRNENYPIGSNQTTNWEWNSREPSKNTLQQSRNPQDFNTKFQPQPSNDLHVEEIFSERNNSFRQKQNIPIASNMRESHENETHLMFQKSIDVNQVEELGLSTHRPEDGQNKTELHSGRSPRALDESMSVELRYALGEKKYQEFLAKSLKDIDALYGDNMSNRPKGGESKDINVRREQYEKTSNSLVGKRMETERNLPKDSARGIERLKVDENTSEGHRPLLNRPKHEPSNIYQRATENVDHGTPTLMSRSKSMDEPHVLSSRNFAFSADEIYSQAYQPHMKSTPLSIPGSGGIGHGHPTQMTTGMSAVGHSHMIPDEFQSHPGLYHSHSYDGSMGQHPYGHIPGEYYVQQNQPGYFVPHPFTQGHPAMVTPRMMSQSPSQKGDNLAHFHPSPNQRGDNSTHFYHSPSQKGETPAHFYHSPSQKGETPAHFYHSPSQKGENPAHFYPLMPPPYPHPHSDDSPGRQMTARSIHTMDPQDMYRFKQQHPQMFPHPPEEHSFDSKMKHHQHVPKVDRNPHHFHPSMARIPHPPEGPNSHPGPHGDVTGFKDYLHLMPKGIPYPPPPNDMELHAYFQYLGSQGYPIPYQSVMPPDSPRDDQHDQGMMIPHPPAEKRESRQGSGHFRRRDHDSSRDQTARDHSPQKEQKDEGGKRQGDEELNNSQRHIEGIRQYHEQKRQQQEIEMLEKQRLFAKESIDRYFSSLEYHSSKQPGHKNCDDKPMEILRESLTDVQTLVNSDVTGVTLNAGGITERMDELGIDLSYLKSKENENSEYKNKGDNSKIRTVIVCPECGEVNKPYMTWCSECSEVLIGIEPIKVKPKRRGDRVKKQGETNDKNYVIHKSVTFDDPNKNEIEQDLNENDDVPVNETERSRSKVSPCKSDGKDSGRPSTEDLDFNRTEHEIDNICQSLSDPVIKGFIKAYFNKKRQELTHRSNEEEVDSSRQDNVVGQKVKTNVQNDDSYNDNRESRHAFRHVDQGMFNDVQYDDRQFENFDENEIDEQPVEDLSYPHPIDNIQNPSNVHHHHLENEEVWLHEHRSPRMDVPMNRKHMPIDIEVFTLEESREGKYSQRDPLVPSLNLANSSDEEENGIKRDKKPFVPLSMSAESEDWQDFFHNNDNLEVPQEEPILESPNTVEEEDPKPFLAQLLDHQPKTSKRPPSASTKSKKSNPNVKSVVKESIDAPLRQRKWAKSSTAWSSYNARELSTKSSLNKSRPSSAGSKRPSSGGTRAVASTPSQPAVPRRSGSLHNLSSVTGSSDVIPGRKKVLKNNRPVSADLSLRLEESNDLTVEDISHRQLEVSDRNQALPTTNNDLSLPINKPESSVYRKPDSFQSNKKPESSLPTKKQESPKSLPYVIDHRLPAADIEPLKDLGKVQSAYSMYQEMTPRIQQGKFSAWLCLPDEIMLQIFSFLSHSDLINAALSCKQYYRVALDETLWRYITLKKKYDMDDETLENIGHRHPVSLALIQCHGDNITAKGLRDLFKESSDSLRELNICGCSKGALTGDCILLHASVRCHNLTHIDASWCMVTDSGIGAISSTCKRLESLCINGCQNVTDEGLETVIKKHGASLRVLEMFGCFKITPKGIRYLATHCTNLLTLNLGQCYKLKDSCISQLSASLGRIECLDLRGVKHIKDNCIRYVVKNCPRLKTIVLANCPNISDVALLEISTYLSDIRVIDVCGCRNVTDNSIRALSNNCQNLRNIDISSTGCTHRSVSMLANFCNQRLEVAKLNFLADVTDAAVLKLVKHCKRLKLLHLYGCTSVKDLRKIQDLNTNLKVEKDL